jgi:hypothetical protein
VDLVEAERAHLCVPLLRPAVEEHLWVSFLETLNSDYREEFLFAKSQVETFETLEAQWNDAGTDVMTQLGFPMDFLDVMRAASELGTKQLKEIARRLGWNLSNNSSVPRTWFIAKQTGNETLYSLIYHATSRTVHFTVAELLRRVGEILTEYRSAPSQWMPIGLRFPFIGDSKCLYERSLICLANWNA